MKTKGITAVLIVSAALIVVPSPAVAGPAAAATASEQGMTIDEVLEAHCAAREELASLRASFKQTKVFTLFDEREESAGEFAFLKPGMVRWRFTSPDSTISAIRGDTAWTVLPHIRQVQKVGLGGSSTDRVMSIIGFGACGEGMRDDFSIVLKEDADSLILLEMIPLAESIAPYFSIIELGLDPDDLLPRLIVFHEHSGDLLIFEFDSVEPGADVDPDEFDFSVPEGFEVVEY
jgi:outer membrane lipoprotein carrier protein